MKKSIASGKRGSVGTLILEALSTGDKYGWEIMKAIEEKSAGEYILKEPSLYSSLKRMETSGLVTSYWQDSDIGGRRHYYNITESGLKKLNASNINWDEEQQFVTELFNAENKKEHNTLSSVDTSINSLNKSVNEVQKTVQKLTQNEKNITRFILETEKQQEKLANTPLVERPVKDGNKLILPTINPMQQDLFSFQSQPVNEPVYNKETQSSSNLEQKLPQTQNTEQFIEKNIENIEEQEVKFQSIEQLEKTKKEKYTSIPTTYVQMPMFEQEEVSTISGIYIEKEQDKTNFVNEIEIKKETQTIQQEKIEKEPIKPTIQYLKNLATEKEFLDIKNAFKNKYKSFVNRTQEYSKTLYSPQNNSTASVYGSFNLEENEEYEKNTPYNNLGLEETLKAKKQLEKEEKSESLSFNNSPTSNHTSSLNTFIQKEQEKELSSEPVKNKDELEDMDLKEILGELFTESEGKEREHTTSTKDLPRINVSDNINVTLRTKKTKEKTENTVDTAPVYTYTYNKKSETGLEQSEPEFEAGIKVEKQELKNFHENLSTDEYSNSLLEDIYFENLLVRTHKIEQKAPLMTTSYVSINKLNFNLSLAMFMFMLIQIIGTYIALTNLGYNTNAIDHSNLILFIVFGALSFVPVIIYSIIYFIFPLRKKEIYYNLINKLGNNIIILLIALVFIYATNLFAGMSTLNRADFIPTLVLPAILSINLLITPIIKFTMLKSKKYYL